ncbi:MAG: DUF3305 domain-containing protein [Alphaproteobacteria bacterium]|nr:MAG: DUF3305 domain-containing protein [Alphaproteobacteria bacterium]
MSHSVTMPVGVVVAREEIDSPWQDHEWRPVAVLPGAPQVEAWTELRQGEGWVHYHAGTVSLELYRKETEAYKFNLEGREPVLYVVLAEEEDEEEGDDAAPYQVHLVTASPFEAQDYLDSGEEIVEPVPMPEPIIAWIQGFIDEHHQEEKFKKRRRDEVDLEEHKFGQEPIVVVRERMAREQEVRGKKNGGS